MIILTLDTEHFHFEAAGFSEPQAFNALQIALAYHGEQYGLPIDWASVYETEKRFVEAGECTRDGQLLYREP